MAASIEAPTREPTSIKGAPTKVGRRACFRTIETPRLWHRKRSHAVAPLSGQSGLRFGLNLIDPASIQDILYRHLKT